MPKTKKNPEKIFINVIKIKDGVVDECSLHTNIKNAEEEFTLTAINMGADEHFMSDYLDDGYFQSLNKCVCFVWPDLKKRPT